jgi:Ca2+-binding EF-hand superfamily protein
MYCPFKKHLHRVFNLEEDNGNNSQNNSVPEIHNEKDEIRADYSNGMVKLKVKPLKPNIKGVSKFNSNQSIGRQYIDFKKFCDIMKVFNFKSPVEQKIKCKIAFIIYIIVYFDLYDIDGDEKISKKDLENFMNIINTKDEGDIVSAENNKEDVNLNNYMESMIVRILKEVITGRKKTSINFQEFKTLMWNTNIDKTCVIYLGDENDS